MLEREAMILIKRCACVLLIAVVGGARAGAEPIQFNFKDPKGVNGIVFVLDSTLEPIMGTASGIEGMVTFDPDKPSSISGTLSLPASTVQTINPRMTEVLHSEDWLDIGSYPKISFSFKRIKDLKKADENVYQMTAVGDFTCRGVTKELTVDLTASYLPGKVAERLHKREGDLLILRTTFKLHRADFGIKPTMGGTLVAEDIELRVAIVGTHLSH